MWGFLGRLFGTSKGMDTALGMANKAVDGIDALVYTKEEKANDIAKMVFKLQDQFTPRAISRRIIAFMFSAVFCSTFTIALVFTCFSKFDVVNAIVDLTVSFQLPWIIVSIIIFYFGYYGLKQLKGKKE